MVNSLAWAFGTGDKLLDGGIFPFPGALKALQALYIVDSKQYVNTNSFRYEGSCKYIDRYIVRRARHPCMCPLGYHMTAYESQL